MSKHERNKSGGFLDTLFTRSAKRNHRNTYSANGTRPVSANENDNEMQDIEILILKLTADEVDQRFTEILEDMNIPQDKRAPLMKKALDDKRDMIKMHLKGKQRNSIHCNVLGRLIVFVVRSAALTQFHAQLGVQLRFLKYLELLRNLACSLSSSGDDTSCA